MTKVHVKHPDGWWPVSVVMAERDRVKGEVAASEIPYLLSHAAMIFEFVGFGMSQGFLKEERFLIALMETCARAYKDMAQDEGVTMERLAHALLAAGGQKEPKEGGAS